MTIYASYKVEYLSDAKHNITNSVIKLAECFGHGEDRTQSELFIPILPGTSTYLLLSNDNSKTNIEYTRWLFIPAVYVRNTTTNHDKYVTIKKSFTRVGHKAINTQNNLTTAFYQQVFNTQDNPEIWKTNFTNWK